MNQDASELTFSFAADPAVAQGGMLLLDNISALKGICPAPLTYALEQVRRGPHAMNWMILATAEADVLPRLGPVRFHIAKLPELNQRTDFEKLARRTLSEFTAQHQISRQGDCRARRVANAREFLGSAALLAGASRQPQEGGHS